MLTEPSPARHPRRFRRALVCTFLGALLCALLVALLFTLGSMLDGTRFEEALAYGLIAGVIAAFCGALIGFLIGMADLSLLGGALTGLLVTFAAVAFYVLAFAQAGRGGYFLGESLIIWIALGLPAILTGLLTALLKKRLFPAPPAP